MSLSLLAAVMTAGAAQAHAAARSNSNGRAFSASMLDRSARAALRRSSVTVLLPASFPPAAGAIRRIVVIEAGPAGYYVGYSALSNCLGGLSCAFFHVAGWPATRRAPEPRDRFVRLADGRRARYRPKDCSGSGCTEASLTFGRAGAVYEIDVKSERDDLLVLEDAYRRLRPLQ